MFHVKHCINLINKYKTITKIISRKIILNVKINDYKENKYKIKFQNKKDIYIVNT